MKVVLDSEVWFKSIVKHRFDICLLVTFLWLLSLAFVMVPIFQYHGWHTGLIALGKAIAPLGILITLFLNFTSAHLSGSQVKTDLTIEFRQIENAMALVAKYDSDDFLAAKQWLKYCQTNEIPPKEVSRKLNQMKDKFWANWPEESDEAGDLNKLRSNIYISTKRLLNYLDEIRLAVSGNLPYANKDVVYDSIGVPTLQVLGLLGDFIKHEQSTLVTKTQNEGKDRYLSDFNDLVEDIKKTLTLKK